MTIIIVDSSIINIVILNPLLPESLIFLSNYKINKFVRNINLYILIAARIVTKQALILIVIMLFFSKKKE